MPRPRLLASLCLAAVWAAAGAGCGSDPPVEVAGRTVELTLTDYRISPQAIRAPRGRLVVRARNDGRLPHNVEIRGPGGRIRMRISTLLPGETGRERVRLPAGEWTIYCSIGNHEELGQHAELVTR